MRTTKTLKSWLALSSLFALTALPASADTFGDVNADGQFNVTDVTLTLQFAVNASAPTPAQLRAADVAPVSAQNVFGDKAVDVSDAIRMLQRIVGIDNTNPWPGARSANDNEPDPGPTGGVPLPKGFQTEAQADVTKEYKLPGGFKLQGKVIGGEGTEDIRFTDEIRKVTVQADPKDRSYTVGVPAGNYKAVALIHHQEGFFSNTTIPVPTGDTVTVNADTSKDITVPAKPQIFKVEGTVAPPEGVQAPFSFSIHQVKDGSGTDITDYSGVHASTFSMDGTYSIGLPAGTYRARFSLLKQGSVGAIEAQETFTVAGDMTQNLSSPQIVKLFGPVTMAGGGPLPAGSSSIIVSDKSPSQHMGLHQIKTGAYSVHLPKGDYTMSFTHSLGGTPDVDPDEEEEGEDPIEIESVSQGSFSYQIGDVSLQAETEKAVTVPAFPQARIKFKGTVVGPDGKPVTKGSVSIWGSNLVGADPKLTYYYSQDLTTAGTFEGSVPPGQYRVSVTPDPGFPVTNLPEL